VTRADAISLLRQHEAELKQLGVEHLYMLVRPLGTKPEAIPMSTFFLIMLEVVSACMS